MPTSYTWGVSNGTIVDLEGYVLQCARAFGATIMMRDESLDAPIPEFQPQSYNIDALESAKKKLEELQNLSNDEIVKRIGLEHWYDIDRNKKVRNEKIQERQRYLDMLEKVVKWQAPTPDHIKLKEFCINQLNESMKLSFNDKDLDKYYPLEVVKPTVEEWLKQKIEKCNSDIKYYTKEWENEVERTNERNVWVAQLKDSFEK